MAEGGMGSVWAALHQSPRGHERRVAIKLLLPEFAEDEQYARALRDEAQLAASVRHPNLCEVIELGESGGQPFVVMQWVDGASLSEWLAARPGHALPAPLAAAIVADACAGLHALHRANDVLGKPLGAVHRDVSPHNILLSSRGDVIVADLGVAKARGQWRARTRSGELRGKLGYLAPEQLEGKPVDARTDVYALGCVLYLALTGQLPYPPEISALSRVLSGQYAPPEELVPALPPALPAIVRRALELEPSRRFESAHAMRRALCHFDGALSLESRRECVQAALHESLGRQLAAREAELTAELAALRASPEE